jgi:hypothetical protein
MKEDQICYGFGLFLCNFGMASKKVKTACKSGIRDYSLIFRE